MRVTFSRRMFKNLRSNKRAVAHDRRDMVDATHATINNLSLHVHAEHDDYHNVRVSLKHGQPSLGVPPSMFGGFSAGVEQPHLVETWFAGVSEPLPQSGKL